MLLMGNAPFQRFEQLSRALFRRTGQTHKISLLRLYDLVHDIAVDDLDVEAETCAIRYIKISCYLVLNQYLSACLVVMCRHTKQRKEVAMQHVSQGINFY